MVEFKRNPKTGELESYKDGKRVGSIFTMGDCIRKKDDGAKPKPKAKTK